MEIRKFEQTYCVYQVRESYVVIITLKFTHLNIIKVHCLAYKKVLHVMVILQGNCLWYGNPIIQAKGDSKAHSFPNIWSSEKLNTGS